MLDKEYKFYQSNQRKLLDKYKGKFLVIKGTRVIGVYPSEKEAYEETTRKHKLGTFLIQECLPKEDREIQTFHTRVVLS